MMYGLDGALLAGMYSSTSTHPRMGSLQRNERCHPGIPGRLSYPTQTEFQGGSVSFKHHPHGVILYLVIHVLSTTGDS